MKWTAEDIDILKDRVSLGLGYEDIAIILNRTSSSIMNKMKVLGLKMVFTKESECKNCNCTFTSYISENRVFCSSSCSATFNNQTRERKIKEKKAPTKKEYKPKTDRIRYCKACKEDKLILKNKVVCEDCKLKYYKLYRPNCEFNFNISEFSDKFDLELIKRYGWYSPSNKGNNLNGVSKDHMYSVKEGFLNNIAPEIISHPANCKLLKHSENNVKNIESSITLEELLDRINSW